MNNSFYALIMAGGSGTRFWPASTTSRPKQYLSLVGGEPLLTSTLKRLEGVIGHQKRYVVTVREQKQLVLDCLSNCAPPENIIFEPNSRNTAACILLSLATLLSRGIEEDAVVAILPSDHVILNTEAMRGDLERAAAVATDSDQILTIGIVPHYPHSGYGYIERGKAIGDNHFQVSSFKEKPDVETAKEYLKAGNYYWNGGMFVATIKTFLQEFATHAQDIFSSFDELKRNALNFERVSEVYKNIPAESIDYAVMEKSSKVAVLPASFDWNDLGSWEAMADVLAQRDGNTVIATKGDCFKDSRDNIVYAPERFVALMGVDNLVVVDSGEALVVFPKGKGQGVKEIVSTLKGGEFEKLT